MLKKTAGLVNTKQVDSYTKRLIFTFTYKCLSCINPLPAGTCTSSLEEKTAPALLDMSLCDYDRHSASDDDSDLSTEEKSDFDDVNDDDWFH